MQFDLIDLRLFVRHAEECNRPRAALRQHLSLAAASARIKALETQTGLPLLYREAHLTPPGEAFLHHAPGVIEGRADIGIVAGQVGTLSLQTIHFGTDRLGKPLQLRVQLSSFDVMYAFSSFGLNRPRIHAKSGSSAIAACTTSYDCYSD